jgi:hypothetical protein
MNRFEKRAGPSGLKFDRNHRDHALTGVAISCQPLGPNLSEPPSARQSLCRYFGDISRRK